MSTPITKDRLIELLQKSPLPGDAEVRFCCGAMVDGDIDTLVGVVTDVRASDGKLVIGGDGVDPSERQAWDERWGHLESEEDEE